MYIVIFFKKLDARYASQMWYMFCDVSISCSSLERKFCHVTIISLELRRLHLDLIFCSKLVFNLVSVNFSRFFEFSHVQKTRGHAYKLYKPRSNCSVCSRFFAERVVNVWNDLPSTVNFAALASYKRTSRDVDFSEYMRCY